MKFRFDVARRAEREIRAASEWWIANRREAPLLFSEELESAFDFVEEFPYAGEHVPHVRRGVRRVLLTRVRYHLYYSIDQRNRISKFSRCGAYKPRHKTPLVTCAKRAIAKAP